MTVTELKFRKASLGGKLLYLLFEVVLIAYAVAVLFPLCNMVFSSFKTTREIFLDPFRNNGDSAITWWFGRKVVLAIISSIAF